MSSEAGRFVTITMVASFIGSRSIITVAYQHARLSCAFDHARAHIALPLRASIPRFPNPSTISGSLSRLPALVQPVSGFRVLQTRPPVAYRVAEKRCDLIIRPCQLRFFDMPSTCRWICRVSRDLTLILLSMELVTRQK